jgi:hypothetical protein
MCKYWGKFLGVSRLILSPLLLYEYILVSQFESFLPYPLSYYAEQTHPGRGTNMHTFACTVYKISLRFQICSLFVFMSNRDIIGPEAKFLLGGF